MIGDILLAVLSTEALDDKVPIKSVYFALGELSKDTRYASLLAALNFAPGPDVPLSEELETAMFRLCSSGLCTIDNPDYRFLRTDKESRKAMLEALKRHLTEDKLSELGELSAEFQKRVSSCDIK